MKTNILWACLVEFPPLCEYLGHSVPPHCGWLYSSAKSLINEMPEINLGIAVYSNVKKLEKYCIDGVSYYLIPSKNIAVVSNCQIESCRKTISDFSPHIIHVHGTEHSLAKAMCIASDGQTSIVANIQGLAGPCTQYANGYISWMEMLKNVSFADIYRRDFLFTQKRKMRRRGMQEKWILEHISNVIGRTQWDEDNVLSINPNLKYFFMNESLRDSFYEGPRWEYEKCKKHSIFVSSSFVPLKGAHNVIYAMKNVVRRYPDAIVNFCGNTVMTNVFKTRLKFTGYDLFLRRLVKKMGLENNVRFLGSLSEGQMKQQFLNANLYVLPSAIENSPNSLCEAQLLGVPVIASYCGGVPSLVRDGVTGYLYRFEEVSMLSQLIMRLFDETDFTQLCNQEREAAIKRHDRKKNAKILIGIYSQIIDTYKSKVI